MVSPSPARMADRPEENSRRSGQWAGCGGNDVRQDRQFPFLDPVSHAAAQRRGDHPARHHASHSPPGLIRPGDDGHGGSLHIPDRADHACTLFGSFQARETRRPRSCPA